MQTYPAIGIRPIIDARRLGIRDELEGKTREMAEAAKKLIEKNVFYADGTPARCVISSTSISGGEEAARCEAEFSSQNVCATLSVTPSWCYPLETIDLNPLNVKAIWGFNGTERPGAVYLAAAMSAHNQMGIPVFSIYGHDVQDMEDSSIPGDVQEMIIQFAQCALAVGQMRNKSYVSIGGVSMGIMGSQLDPKFYIQYLGMRPEWIDMTEILRRIELKIYDQEEYERALAWIKANCPEGFDRNRPELKHTPEQKAAEWEFIAKMTIIVRDIMLGNKKLEEMGWQEEALGKNALFCGFQGQRAWTDWKPNADFTEAIMNSSFDWNGKKQPRINLVEGVGPTLQIAEGYSCVLPEHVHQAIDKRTDPTWPCTWFAPRTTGQGPFKDVYSVMANWGSNHGCFAYGHIGAQLITLASMLRIPVSMHNVETDRIFRPHTWTGFGTESLESADFKACAFYGPMYK